MKRLLITCILCAACAGIAQTELKKPFKAKSTSSKRSLLPPSSLYAFTTFTAPYQEISGISLSNGLKWDGPTYTVNIGFNFSLYNGIPNDTINFFGGQMALFEDVNTASYMTIASPFLEDVCDRAYDPNVDTEGDPGGVSNISYTTTGTAPNRICKIQVKNAGFYNENQNAPSVSYVNYQLWLYETTNDVEFRYGTMNIQNPAINLTNPTGFVCGLIDSVDVNTAVALPSNMLNGPYNSPAVVDFDASLAHHIAGGIDSGRVYRFAKGITTQVKLPSYASRDLKVYPNPASKTLFVNGFSDGTLDFYDVAGKLIFTTELQKQTDISSLPPGVYFVKIKDKNAELVQTSRLIVTD